METGTSWFFPDAGRETSDRERSFGKTGPGRDQGELALKKAVQFLKQARARDSGDFERGLYSLVGSKGFAI